MRLSAINLSSRRLAIPVSDGRLWSLDAGVAFATALVLPVGLAAAGAGGFNRYLYPVTALLVGGMLAIRRSPWLIGYCIWVFCAVSLVRRLTDLSSGWDPANPILLAPYLACLCAATAFVPYVLRRPTAYAGTFLAMVGCIVYGFLLALLDGRSVSGLVDAMKWCTGPVFAVYILAHADARTQNMRAATNAFLVAGPAMGAYGTLQFLNPQIWDREWMINVAASGLTSIGQPAPFEIRVFSTMNSPGSFAAVMLVSFILLARQRIVIAGPAGVVVILGLTLSQYRAVWAGTVIGVLVVLVTGPGREKARIVGIGSILILASGLLASQPELSDTIFKRLETLSAVSNDESGQDRWHQYVEFMGSDESAILGQGLAITGAARQLDGRTSVVIDSGIIETFTAMGIVVGTVSLTAMGFAIVSALRSGRHKSSDASDHLSRAVVVACFVQLPFGSIHVGENGFWLWLFVGFALSGRIGSDADRARAEPGLHVIR